MEKITDNITLYNANCLDILPTLPDKSVDAIITDPPYNETNRKTDGLRQIDKGEADSAYVPIDILADEFVRISSGSIYVWCLGLQLSYWAEAFISHGLTIRYCAWQKTNPSPMNGQYLWLTGVELCIFARHKKAPFFEHCKVPVWRGPTQRYNGHPVVKPVWLMEELVNASVPIGGTVLDPFMGSGTTALACKERNFMGIEIDNTYYNIAKQRILSG